MQTKTARLMFYVGAIFNWCAVLIFLPTPGIASNLGIDPAPTGTLFEIMALGAVFVFGIGYWMVGNAPGEHRGIVKLGIIGKLLVVAIVAGYYFSGSANLSMMVVISGDLLFAALFTLYLRTTPATSR